MANIRFSWNTITLIIFIVIFSIFAANVTNLINIDANLSSNINITTKKIDWKQRRQLLHLDDRSDHLMWFLQISDIHISIFNDEERITQFRQFITQTIDTINPSVVLASGDLTDAKDRDLLGSRQYKKEWKIYRTAIDDSGVLNRTVWLDIRGNHDNFNVPSDNAEVNYFRTYGVQGAEHRGSYMKQIKKGQEIYTFIAVDACLRPGPKRPFNFFGYLLRQDTEHIIQLANEARKNGGNYTIWFGHYPTSCVISMETGSLGLRKLIGQYEEGIAYLCGHLHQLGGAVKQMYALQHDGFLELELADWKHNRTFRLAAIDHGLFSFVDMHHNNWPVVLITNPKHALFNIPAKEDPMLQIESTHIRLLAFSPAGIKKCSVKINEEEWMPCNPTDNNNLFVVKWKTKNYLHGIHQLTAEVYDNIDRVSYVKQPFSLDGSRISFDLLARFILMNDASQVLHSIFAVALSLCVVPLFFFRGWHLLVLAGKLNHPKVGRTFFGPCFRRFWILSTIDRIMLPIVGYCLYLSFGPWHIGEILDGYTGVIFAWGIYVNGGYVPCALTYLYGFAQLIFCQLPLICIYAKNIERNYYRYIGRPETKTNKITNWLRNFLFFIIIAMDIILAIFFSHTSSLTMFLLGPFRVCSILLNCALWHYSKTIPHKALSSAIQTWTSR